jgi:uncharacterized repeat protein (TIGR01451 family)
MKRLSLVLLSVPILATVLARPGTADGPGAVMAAPGANLQVTKTVDNAAPNEGDSITYTIVVTNNGLDDTTGVEVTDLLPSGVTYVSDVPSVGVYNPVTGVWLVGNLPYGGSRTLWITAAVDSGTGGTIIVNWAEITASDQPDPDISDNAARADISVASPPTPTATATPTPTATATPTPTATATTTPSPTATPPPGATRVLHWEPGWHNDSWSGPDSTVPQDALACASGKYAAAYRIVSGTWERYFPNQPDISNMGPLDKYDAFLILITAPVNCTMPIDP